MAFESVDPTVLADPSFGWSGIVAIVAALHVFTLVAAAVSVLMSPRLAPGGRLLWIVVLLALPFVGAIAWFLWGRSARLERQVG